MSCPKILLIRKIRLLSVCFKYVRLGFLLNKNVIVFVLVNNYPLLLGMTDWEPFFKALILDGALRFPVLLVTRTKMRWAAATAGRIVRCTSSSARLITARLACLSLP